MAKGMNLKLPVAANAMNLTKKQPNTPEGEAIASVAVAVSSHFFTGKLF